MLHTKFQGHGPSGSREDFKVFLTIYGHVREDFKVFFNHIWACQPFWSCDQNNLYKFRLTCRHMKIQFNMG